MGRLMFRRQFLKFWLNYSRSPTNVKSAGIFVRMSTRAIFGQPIFLLSLRYMKFKLITLILFLVLCTACGTKEQSTETANEGPIKVTLTIDFEGDQESIVVEQLTVTEQKSLRAAMVEARKLGYFTFADTLYEGMGHLLTSINGAKTGDSRYWLYCVNSQKASKGIDDLLLKDGDHIKWVLTDRSNPCN